MFQKKIRSWIGIFALGTLAGCNAPTPWFEEIKDSGISFENRILESDQDNALDFLYVYNGGGVGVADLNGDNLPDLCFTGNQTPGKLYKNKGNFAFEDISHVLAKPILGWCTGVSWADINLDNKPDLIISRSGNVPASERKNLVYLNPGKDGEIWQEVGEEIGLADEGWTTQTIWLDFDRDGDLDVYVLNASNEERYSNRVQFNRSMTGPAADRLYVNLLAETGKLQFVDKSKETGIQDDAFGLGVTTGDFNNDGWPDLYVANDFLGHDLLYLNTGKGSFREVSRQLLPYSSHFSMGCTLMDVNEDGLDDIFVADMMPSSSNRRLRMTGPLSNESMHYVEEQGYHRQYMRNTLQVQHDQGFVEVAQAFQIEQTDWSWSPVAADFSNDGITDLFISNGYLRDITDMDFIAYNAQLGQSQGRMQADKMVKGLIQKQTSLAAENRLFSGTKNGFDAVPWTGELDISHAAIEVDLDGDGTLDLVINRLNAPAQIFRNRIAKPTQQFIDITLVGSAQKPLTHGTRIDFFAGNRRWTRYQQPVRGYQASALTSLHVGLGEYNVLDSLIVTWPDGFRQRLDQVPSGHQRVVRSETDLDAPTPAQGSSAGLPSQDSLGYVALEPTTLQQDRLPALLITGDWDQDQKIDTLYGGTLERPTSIQWGNGTSWTKPSADLNQWVSDVQWADLNQDGTLDLIIGAGGWMFERNSTFVKNEIWYQKPTRQFEKSPFEMSPFPTRQLLVQDFDENGLLDILVLPGRWLHHYGSWEKPRLIRQLKLNQWQIQDTNLPAGFYTGGVSTSATTGWLVGELLPVMSFRYEHSSGFSVTDLPNSVGLWQCIKPVGRGFVVGNWGVNSVLRNGPARVWLDDWDQNGLPDPIWIGPDGSFIASREDLLKQLPLLRKPFSTYAKFADNDAQTLPAWLGKSSGGPVEINEMRSMWLENETLEPLSQVAQWGILRSVMAEGGDTWRGTLSDAPLHVMNRGAGGTQKIKGNGSHTGFKSISKK